MEKRTYSDRKEYIKSAVVRRRQKLKLMGIEYLGGKCAYCGYQKCAAALEFHHIDSSTKSFGIGAKGFSKSWDKIKTELDKCQLICSNCHKELHHC